jgi:hypothetical protein
MVEGGVVTLGAGIESFAVNSGFYGSAAHGKIIADVKEGGAGASF